ncbi:MAG: FtsX-like permease family protein [Brevibacterium aurantiacum]|uniref:FtsX-like permease family protein n=1 Tax=Micrococcales TaxID=85006 RepID=UPI001080A042|nr:FtsX-like permease family protein [Brevibacterium sp. S111]TGD11625.1 FtsX-like permease family protein [Brevibacterium sp. S111]
MASSTLTVALRDIQRNKWVWSSAVLVAITVSIFITWCLNFLVAVTTAPDSFFTDLGSSKGEYVTLGSNMLVFSGVPAVIVLAIVLAGVTAQTAVAQSLWRLGGASPPQVTAMILVQAVAVCCSGVLAGVVLALPFQGRINDLLIGIGHPDAPSLPAVLSVWAMVGAVAILAALAVIAAVIPAWRAAQKSPVALRSAPDVATRPGLSYLIAVVAVFVVAVLPLFASLAGVVMVDEVALAVVVTLPLIQALAVTTALVAPWLLPLVIIAWTKPFALASSPSWRVARHMAIARIAGSAGTVAPLTLGIGLFGTFGMISATAANVSPLGASLNTLEGILLLLPVGVISGVGSIAVVVMAARQHTEDIVTLRSATATQAGTDLIMVFEALIITVSAVIIGMIPIGIEYGLLAFALASHGHDLGQIGIAIGPTALLVGVAFIGMTSALLVAARSAWRKPLVDLLADR